MKRFVECNRWDDRWFHHLSPDTKLIFSYLCDQCDHGGVWDCNFDMAVFKIGFARIGRTIDWEATFEELNSGKRKPGAIVKVPGSDTWWITNFINFQYGPTKLRNIPPHIPIFRALLKAGIWPMFLECFSDMVDKECKPNPPVNVKSPFLPPPAPSVQEVRAWDESEGLPDSEVLHFHSYWTTRAWRRGNLPIYDRKAALIDWKCRWIKTEDKKHTPADLTRKIEAINKEMRNLGNKQRLKPGTSFVEPDPEAMREIRELKSLRKRYEEQLRGKTESAQPSPIKELPAPGETTDPPLS